MTSSSKYGDFYDVDTDDIINADRPLSAAAAVDIVNNARHLRDESTQYRVKWEANVATTSGLFASNAVYAYTAPDANYYHVMTHVFPWQSYPGEDSPRMPVGRVFVQNLESAATSYLRLYMMPYHFPIGYDRDQAMRDESFGWRRTVTLPADNSGDGWWTCFTNVRTGGDDKQMAGLRAEWNTWSVKNIPTWEHNTEGTATINVDVPMHFYRVSMYAKNRLLVKSFSLREFAR